MSRFVWDPDDIVIERAVEKFNPNHDERGRFSSGEGGGGEGEGKHPGHGYSKDAYVDKDGVIQTHNVRDALRGLYENRKVNLEQPREVSTLIGKLGEVSDRMIRRGGEERNFNLCNVTVSGTNLFCAESHGIPREKMPQLTDKQTSEFPEHLKSQGFDVKNETELASHLRATQNVLNGAKVAKAAQYIRDHPEAADRPIIISKDGYILDGHHTWAAKIGLDAQDGILSNDKPMNVSRINIGTIEMLHRANKFTGYAGRKGALSKRLALLKLRLALLTMSARDADA